MPSLLGTGRQHTAKGSKSALQRAAPRGQKRKIERLDSATHFARTDVHNRQVFWLGALGLGLPGGLIPVGNGMPA
jgi:hypothetical protein